MWIGKEFAQDLRLRSEADMRGFVEKVRFVEDKWSDLIKPSDISVIMYVCVMR